MTPLTPQDLIRFESQIASDFNSGLIRAPIHLSSGNEEQLISIFSSINPDDWVFSTWRSHYHCLLKGVPPDVLRSDILSGKSISLCYKKYNVFSSAIVTGILPIAVGLAKAIHLEGRSSMVYCFIGDMTAESGTAHECIKYANNFKLPIKFVIENNFKSVCSDTEYVWGDHSLYKSSCHSNVIYYEYDSSKYPHAGSGKRKKF